MECYLLDREDTGTPQQETDASFLGGLPKLPPDQDFPVCHLCGVEQTFFFQVAFPLRHLWSGFSLAVFGCTSCEEEDHLIPSMLLPLRDVDIPEGFFDNYQVNFRFLVFDSASAKMRRDYVPRIKFTRWILKPTSDGSSARNKIGGKPVWILDDESPAMYRSSAPMIFLLQIEENFKFEMVSGAPPQRTIDFSEPQGSTRPSPEPFYRLFVGNALYLFGTAPSSNERFVYAIVQSD